MFAVYSDTGYYFEQVSISGGNNQFTANLRTYYDPYGKKIPEENLFAVLSEDDYIHLCIRYSAFARSWGNFWHKIITCGFGKTHSVWEKVEYEKIKAAQKQK